jgi:hypothetical protein
MRKLKELWKDEEAVGIIPRFLIGFKETAPGGIRQIFRDTWLRLINK